MINASISKNRVFLSLGLIALISILFQNCGGTKVGFASLNLQEGAISSSDVKLEDVPFNQALVYGSSPEDRVFLAERIAGFEAPAMEKIFGNWRRLSGGNIYPSAADIAKTPGTEFCYSNLNPTTGYWESATDPSSGNSVNPSFYGTCANDAAFASSSWTLLSNPDRIHNSTNAGNFNGFISGLPYSRYVNEATVGSKERDDDLIALIIAVAVDEDDVIHTLSAARSQGGVLRKGWGIVYKQNNTTIRTFGEQSVDGTNKNKNSKTGDPGDGDTRGWDDRKALIKVERDDNIIRATTSQWAQGDSLLSYDSNSLIELDLSDPSLELEIFQGPAYYGYGIHSQAGSNFSDIRFSTPFETEFVYDIQEDLVFQRSSAGVYDLLKGQSAFETLGYPSRVGNVETQKEFFLEALHEYSRIK